MLIYIEHAPILIVCFAAPLLSILKVLATLISGRPNQLEWCGVLMSANANDSLFTEKTVPMRQIIGLRLAPLGEKAIVSIATHEHTTPFELVRSAANQRRQDLKDAK